MSPLQANIEAKLLPELSGATANEKWQNCAGEYPWYPLPWLMLAATQDKHSVQKAALWFSDEQKLHCLLHAAPIDQDEWLKKSLEAFEDEPGFVEEQTETLVLDHEPIEDTEDITTEAPPPEVESTAVTHEAEEPATEIEDVPASQDVPEEIKDVQPLEEPTPADVIIATPVAEAPSAPVVEVSSPAPSLMPAPGPTPAESLVFEPYHSVDYFASQGIKLQLPTEPSEKFDRQLKSFTQWLKTMKKVAVQESISRPADPLVEAQANASVSGKEIITEAMAQVLEKQGKYSKAIEIYKKLLLLHPEKSVFFAAQIEELKNKQ